MQKLTKLNEKQLPLLHHSATVMLLDEMNLTSTDFIQSVYFKAQLFVPFDSLTSSFEYVNKDCIKGFYIRYRDLSSLANHTYYIPSKLDWLIEPHTDVEWMTTKAFQNSILSPLSSHSSPLCWIKSNDGGIQIIFVV